MNIEYIEQESFIKERKQSQNNAIKNHYANADHFYIDKHLESLKLLEDEREQLEKLSRSKSFSYDEQLSNRLEFLNADSTKQALNKIAFAEGAVQTYPFFTETIETLINPVEINVSDLKKLLCRIEGETIGQESTPAGRPQLIISEFRLDRKSWSKNNQVYKLNMKLIKREFN